MHIGSIQTLSRGVRFDTAMARSAEQMVYTPINQEKMLAVEWIPAEQGWGITLLVQHGSTISPVTAWVGSREALIGAVHQYGKALTSPVWKYRTYKKPARLVASQPSRHQRGKGVLRAVGKPFAN